MQKDQYSEFCNWNLVINTENKEQKYGQVQKISEYSVPFIFTLMVKAGQLDSFPSFYLFIFFEQLPHHMKKVYLVV